MSSRRSLYAVTYASWFTGTRESSRSELERLLRADLKLVRQLYKNFDSAHGFDARRIRYWQDQNYEDLKRFAAAAHRMTSGEFHILYTLHRPRSSAQRQALIQHTDIVSPDEDRHPQAAWPIYANTRTVKVRYVKERVSVGVAMGRPIYEDRLRAEVRQAVPGGVLVSRDYLFREVLGFQPGLESTSTVGMIAARALDTTNPWDQTVRAMRMLLPYLPDRTRGGNEVYYRLLADRGPIGTSVPKHMLVHRMQQWGEDYDVRFAGVLIGVRYQGDEFKAVRGLKSLDAKSERRRARYQQLAIERDKARARIGRRGEILPKSRVVKKTSKRVKKTSKLKKKSKHSKSTKSARRKK